MRAVRHLIAFMTSAVLAVLVLTSCPNFFSRFRLEGTPLEGASLVQYKGYLYCVGGFDAEGKTSADVFRTALTAPPGTWELVSSLPAPRAHAFVFAAGKLLYVIGGEDDEGPSDTVYFTLINADTGDLGFTGGKWETNSRSLPYPLSRAAGVLYDGRIFLLGGLSRDGSASPVLASILHARPFQDGQVSHWYKSPQTLSAPSMLGAAAILADRLYFAGGSGTLGVLPLVTSFALGEHGLLSERKTEPPLPVALESPLLVAGGQSLFLLGGKKPGGYSSEVLVKAEAGTWITESSATTEALGPSSARLDGSLICLRNPDSGGTRLTETITSLDLPPGEPLVLPGSGLIAASVTKAAALTITGERGSTVRYRTLGITDSFPESLVETDNSLAGTLTVAAAQRLALQAFSSGGKSSPLVKRHYETRARSGFATLSGSIQVEDQPSSLHQISLEEWYYGETTAPADFLWYRLAVSADDSYAPLELRLADAGSPSSPYTGNVKVSLFETDMFSWIPDAKGSPIRELEGSTDQPVVLSIQSGDYYFLFESEDGLPPEGDPAYTFGISVTRKL